MAALLVVAIAVLCRLLASCPAKKSIRFICIAISVSRHCACVGRQIFRTARAAHGGAADRPPRHRGVSAQASRPEARLSRYRRGHPHPEIRLGGQPEHPPALPGARWGLSVLRVQNPAAPPSLAFKLVTGKKRNIVQSDQVPALWRRALNRTLLTFSGCLLFDQPPPSPPSCSSCGTLEPLGPRSGPASVDSPPCAAATDPRRCGTPHKHPAARPAGYFFARPRSRTRPPRSARACRAAASPACC